MNSTDILRKRSATEHPRLGGKRKKAKKSACGAAYNLRLLVSKVLDILSQEQRVQNSIAVTTQGKEGWKMLAHRIAAEGECGGNRGRKPEDGRGRRIDQVGR
jgi:hypothetical protein